jgi:hypothetical protein
MNLVLCKGREPREEIIIISRWKSSDLHAPSTDTDSIDNMARIRSPRNEASIVSSCLSHAEAKDVLSR